MGIWYSSPSKVVFPETVSAAAPKTEEQKVLIRHRPTCLNSDLEEGITEVNEKRAANDTKAD